MEVERVAVHNFDVVSGSPASARHVVERPHGGVMIGAGLQRE
jgi:hypothetical protein